MTVMTLTKTTMNKKMIGSRHREKEKRGEKMMTGVVTKGERKGKGNKERSKG